MIKNNKMKTILWLDDIRNPKEPYRGNPDFPSWAFILNDHCLGIEDDWETVWVKNYEEFKSWIKDNGLPDAICFDHDLGSGPSGKAAAAWLVEYCIDNQKPLPLYASQSDNSVGRENILSLLDNFKNKYTWK
jgi:hypothetical protein